MRNFVNQNMNFLMPNHCCRLSRTQAADFTIIHYLFDFISELLLHFYYKYYFLKAAEGKLLLKPEISL